MEKRRGEREKLLSRKTTGSSTIFSLDETTLPPLYARSLLEEAIFSPRWIYCADSFSPR
jgi:hypothetical protein